MPFATRFFPPAHRYNAVLSPCAEPQSAHRPAENSPAAKPKAKARRAARAANEDGDSDAEDEEGDAMEVDAPAAAAAPKAAQVEARQPREAFAATVPLHINEVRRVLLHTPCYALVLLQLLAKGFGCDRSVRLCDAAGD